MASPAERRVRAEKVLMELLESEVDYVNYLQIAIDARTHCSAHNYILYYLFSTGS